MADILITGEAQLNPIETAVRGLAPLFEAARTAVSNLSESVASGSGDIKLNIDAAKEAVEQFKNELEFAKKSGAIKGLSEAGRGDLAALIYAFRAARSEGNLFVADRVRAAKLIEETDRRSFELGKVFAKGRAEAREAEADREQAVARIINEARAALAKKERERQRIEDQAHKEAIQEDRRRAREAEKNSDLIVRARDKEANSATALTAISKRLFSVYAAVRLKSFIEDSVNAAIAMERIKNSLIAATGSLEEGAEAFEYTRTLAYKLGLDLASLAKQYGLFSAAVKDTGFTQNQMRSIFESVAEASRVLGLSVEDMQGVFVALQQIATKGTVQMEELRQQLGDRLPGSVAIMAKALGVSQKELFSLTKQGLVPAREALILFDEELRKRLVDGSLTGALSGIQVKINNLRNALFELNASFGEGFAEGASAGIKDIGDEARRSRGQVIDLGKALGYLSTFAASAGVSVVGLAKVSFISLGGLVHKVSELLNQGLADLASFEIKLIERLNNFRKFLRLGKPEGLDEFISGLKEGESTLRGMAQANHESADAAFEYSREILNASRGTGLFADNLDKSVAAGERSRQTAEDLAEAQLVINGVTGKGEKVQRDLIEALRKRIAAQVEAADVSKSAIEQEGAAAEATDKHKSALDKLAEAVIKEHESIEGSLESLTKRGLVLQEAIRLAEQDGVVSVAAAEAIEQKVGELYKGYERLGVAVPQWLQAIADQYGNVTKEQQKFLDALLDSADKAEKRLTEAQDKARDSRGDKFGQDDLDKVRAEIESLQDKKNSAINDLIAAGDEKEIKSAQKKLDDIEKQIADRVKRQEEIRKKIGEQIKNESKDNPDNKKAEELEAKKATLEKEIAGLKAKQSSGSLSPEELDRLFTAEGILAGIKGQLAALNITQAETLQNWNDINEGTDAAQDAWDEYFALVLKQSIDTKLALEQQAKATKEIGDEAEGAAVKFDTVNGKIVGLTNITGKWTSSIREIDGVYTNITEQGASGMGKLESAVSKVIDKTLGATEASEEFVEATSEAGGAAAAAFGRAAESFGDIEGSMQRIVTELYPELLKYQEMYNNLVQGAKLGGPDQ